jgi:hypothetical protein
VPEFIYRTEDIRSEDVLQYFVESKQDRDIVEALKARNPVIVVGSRGVGKSFLLYVAKAELQSTLRTEKVFPVYVTFTKSSLIHTADPNQFQNWMLARVCTRVIRSLSQAGLLSLLPSSLSILAGNSIASAEIPKTRIEQILEQYEDSWKAPGGHVDTNGLPTVEAFKDAMEELCHSLKLDRFALFIDEAAHILLPAQQRQFFTLFRDLRSPYISCNAAVYPGVTSYGETFQRVHDATMISLDRDILSDTYVSNMREIVEKQSDSNTLAHIARNGQNFAVLAYAASGNPRILLKTLARASNVSSQQINEVVREYYRTEIWAEHSTLAEKYVGHRSMVDWGRQFIENDVLPELQKKNNQYLEADRNSTCFFWIHRDAPQPVKEALRLLAYTGIVTEHSPGIKATRAEIGTRYMVNLGCLFALEASPTSTAFRIGKSLTPRRMSEFGANHPSYQELMNLVPPLQEIDQFEVLRAELSKSIDVLDITDWQKQKLKEMDLDTIGDVLQATETKLREAYYVGEKRSRRMRNAAIASVYEYLSG